MFTYDSSLLPTSVNASEEIWMPRSSFPPSRRIIKQAAAALYFESFIASTEPGNGDVPVLLTAHRRMAVGPAVYKQTTAVSMNRDYKKFDLVFKSPWTCSTHPSAADAFVEFYCFYEQHVLRHPVEIVNESSSAIAVVNASAASEPLLIPYLEEDAEAVKTHGLVRHVAQWGSDLWSAIALKCETLLEDVQPNDIPTVALNTSAPNWKFVVEGGLLYGCVETLLSVSSEPEDTDGRVTISKKSEVATTFAAVE